MKQFKTMVGLVGLLWLAFLNNYQAAAQPYGPTKGKGNMFSSRYEAENLWIDRIFGSKNWFYSLGDEGTNSPGLGATFVSDATSYRDNATTRTNEFYSGSGLKVKTAFAATNDDGLPLQAIQ